jgi:hypothetical protein
VFRLRSAPLTGAFALPMLRPILALLLALLAVPATAQAGFFPSEVVDGPNNDILEVGEVDLTRDGGGGVVYTRTDAGAPHVFLSQLAEGAFGAPERMDAGFAPASSQPRIGTSDGGRMALAWVNEGNLYTRVRARGAAGFAAPTLVAQGGVSNPSIDISINGATYVSWTQNGDVRVARAERDSAAFTVLPAPVDVDPARDAGTGPLKRSRIDVSADGTALVVWGEDGADGRTHVYARRLFELRLSQAPQDLTLAAFDGQAAGNAVLPEVDMQDDSSYAQVVFRQETAAGPRVVMRRLVGSAFDDPVAIDSGAFATSGKVDLMGRGHGLTAVTATGNEVFGGTLFNRRITGMGRLDAGSAVAPQPVPAVGQNERGVVAFLQGSGPGDAVVRGRFFDSVERLVLTEDAILSRPEFGPVDSEAGLDASASRAADVAIVFVQRGPEGRRLVAAFQDRVPSRMVGSNTEKIRRLTKLRWSASLNLLGPMTYTVFLNGRPIAQTRGIEHIPAPGQIPDGEHRWQVSGTDRRGQTVVSRSRRLRVDNTAPTLRVSTSRKKRVLTVTARAGDPNGALPSGLDRVLVDFGSGRLQRMTGTRMSNRYARLGTYTVRVKAVDKAGNETVVARRVRIG